MGAAHSGIHRLEGALQVSVGTCSMDWAPKCSEKGTNMSKCLLSQVLEADVVASLSSCRVSPSFSFAVESSSHRKENAEYSLSQLCL